MWITGRTGWILKLIFMTVWKVLEREGISYSGHATMKEFKGDI